MQCLTFFWKEHPRFWVGYRVLEGLPETHPRAVSGDAYGPVAGWGAFPAPAEDRPFLPETPLPRKRWRTAYQGKGRLDPALTSFQAYHDGSASCTLSEGNGMQQRELLFRPVEQGVEMWIRLTTQVAIDGAYLVQQCLRFTGARNWALRRHMARVPFLSELDVQAMGHPDLTLTYARHENGWHHFPARHCLYATPQGSSLTEQEFTGSVDHGLIVRETLDRDVVPSSYFRRTAPGETWMRISAGMYWERTAWISNRHPADCVHAVVDLGPLRAGESRTVHGKFYWLEAPKDDLLAAWQKDFTM